MKVKTTVVRVDNSPQVRTDIDRGRRIALTKAALLVLGEAQLHCPVGVYPAGSGQVGGRLRASLAYEVESDVAIVGTNVFYGPYVEYGTYKMKAQPFLRSALYDNVSRIKKIFEQDLGGAIA